MRSRFEEVGTGRLNAELAGLNYKKVQRALQTCSVCQNRVLSDSEQCSPLKNQHQLSIDSDLRE